MSLPRPSPLRITVRIFLLALSAVLIFGATALLCSLAVLWFKPNAQVSVGLGLLGVDCGLIAWLFIAVFHIRRESLTLVGETGAAMLPLLRRELEELGYEAGVSRRGCTTFKPRFSAYLLGGAVQVTEHPGGVVITGPKVFVEILRKQLKILHHLTTVQQSIRDNRARQGRNLLRRVEIDLRVSAAQWQKIYDEVITVLAAQDADVVCEVHILAQNESGILDTTVETDIRERLRQQNIAVEIRKEPRPSANLKPAAVCAR